jgi:hypothetical protein
MAKFKDLVGRTVGVVFDAETPMADWTPQLAGRLKKVIIVVGGIAATSLVENGYIKLSSSDFGGIDMYAPFCGGGIFTAVWERSGSNIQVTECDLKISKTPIRVFYYHNVIPTTPEITIFAEIEG